MTITAPWITDPVSDRLESLAACLCAQIEIDGSPPTCFCGVMPGGLVALDYTGDCEHACGMAWVRLLTAYPSTVVGVPNILPGNCGNMFGLEIEVGIVRCASVPAEDGTPPSAAQLLGDTEQQIADMLTMRRAMVCCIDAQDMVLGSYTPYGPEGGLVGGTWTLSVQVNA